MTGVQTCALPISRKEWDESIEAGKFPAFTRENIVATFQCLHDSRDDIFERGVLAVFKSLSWCYKTNRPFAFGKRIVVTYLRSAVKGGSGASLGYVNHSSTDSLDDLARCFCILDGKPEADHRHAMYGAISSVRSLADGDADTEYMSVKSYRNGNGHVLFKRPDLGLGMLFMKTCEFAWGGFGYLVVRRKAAR